MIQDLLEEVYASAEGCRLVAFADLSAKLVLSTNEASSYSRNALNSLCEEAVCLAENGPIGMVGTPDEVRLFFRADKDSTDGLICVCEADTDVKDLIVSAQDGLLRLKGD